MVKVLCAAKVHGNNKLTLPKELRECLKIKDGDYVKFILDGDKVIVKKVEP